MEDIRYSQPYEQVIQCLIFSEPFRESFFFYIILYSRQREERFGPGYEMSRVYAPATAYKQ